MKEPGGLFASNLNLWLGAKRRNWDLLNELVSQEHCIVIKPEHESCNVFSFVVLLDDKAKRDKVRKYLIDNSVYPAILWNVPETASAGSKSVSEKMLSIHCDGRYNEEDIRQLAGILNKAFES